MSRFNYSEYKILNYPDHIDKLRNGFDPDIIHAQVFLTNVCNSNCHFCYYAIRNSTNFEYKDGIVWERMDKLLDEMKESSVAALTISGGGESTLYKQWDKFATKAQSLFDLGLITNGVFSEKILPYDWEWVRISLNASNSDIYKHIEQGTEKEFDKVVASLPELVRQTNVGLGFVITERNYEDVENFALFAKSLGVHNVRFGVEHDGEGIGFLNTDKGKDIRISIEEQLVFAELLQDDSFKIFTPRHKINGDKPDFPECHQSMVSTLIGANLKAYTCCIRSYEENYCIGDLSTNTFGEVIAGEQRKEVMKNLDIRRDCDGCHYLPKNKLLDYLIKNDGENVSFV